MRSNRIALVVLTGTVAAAMAASAARGGTTLVVDDDKAQCPGAGFTTIQAAVSAAAPGDTIRVCAGTYATTDVNKAGLTLVGDTGSLGAERCLAGTGGTNSATDSIVNGGFTVSANDVEIRHFTVRNAAGIAGIRVAGTLSGTEFRNNVVQHNTLGLLFNSNGAHASVATGNCVRDNDAAGSFSGTGIRSDQGLRNARIEGNIVTGHATAAMILAGAAGTQTNVRILDNRIVDDAAIGLANLTGSTVWGNVSRNSRSEGIVFAGGSSNVLVAENVVERCAFTGISVRYLPGSFAPVSTNNHHLDIRANRVTYCRDAGIRLRDGAFSNLVRNNVVATNGTAAGATGVGDGIGLENSDANRVEGNRSVGNVDDGLFADATSTDNAMVGNTMDANGVHDCHDDSSGSRTAGTANVWTSNRGDTQNRAGLCRPTGDDDQGAGRQRKVTICHHGHTIRVSRNALGAHLRHGDILGACRGERADDDEDEDDDHEGRDDDERKHKGKHKGDKHKGKGRKKKDD